MNELELLLRGGALGLAILFAAVSLRRPEPALRVLGLGLAIGMVAIVLLSGSIAADWSLPVRFGLKALAVVGVYAFWALSQWLFGDRFAPRLWHLAPVGVAIAGVVLAAEATSPMSTWVARLLVEVPLLIALADVAWRVVRELRADLVARRRQLRWLFVMAVGLFGLVGVAWPLGWDPGPQSLLVRVGLAALLFAALVVLAVVLIEAPQEPSGAPGPDVALQNNNDVRSDPDARDVARVLAAMDRDHVYRETGLTIASLGQKLGIPEYRLRKLINQNLKYRNFSFFLNRWRLKEAAVRLADPSQARLPILTIALDLGFGSIGPFNRAFKAAHGVTPSDFRRARLGSPLAESSNP